MHTHMTQLLGHKEQFELQSRQGFTKEGVSSTFLSDEGLNGALEGAIHLPTDLVRRTNIHQPLEKGIK